MKTNIFKANSKIHYLAMLMVVLSVTSLSMAETMTIDFESTSAPTGWTNTNFTFRQTNSNVKAHGGSYYGGTGAKSSAKLQTTSKIASPTSLSFYYTKQTTNNTASTWYIKVSTDGTSWTTVASASASSGVTRGTWLELTADLSDYSNVYVLIEYGGTTAVRCIDDVTLTYGGASCDNKVTLTKAAATNGSFVLKEGSASGTEIASGGTVDNCDANAIVYIVPTPSTGYKVNGTPTATNSASVTADGSNYKITYTKGASKASTVTVNFTAQSYTVTLNKNGGTGGTASVTATYNATCPAIGGAVPTKTGYDFTGYYSGSGGTGTKVVNADLTWVATASGYTSSSKWVKAATTTLYAGWAPKSYTVTWKVNGVAYSTGSPSTSVNHGEHVTTLPTAPSPASYCGDKFMGWTTVENYDAGTAPSPLFTTASEAPTASGNQVFYAVFGYY